MKEFRKGDLVKDVYDYSDCGGNAVCLSGRTGIVIKVMNSKWDRIHMVRVLMSNGKTEDYEYAGLEVISNGK
mgnify:CR=1 FL=1|tara:strand:- start:217 stop:432 length:216 start_codon:yes stop_codon:yes gene_type:complete